MEAVLLALLPLLKALLAGESVHEVLAGLTIEQWAAIAEAVLSIEDPTLVEAIKQTHPILSSFLEAAVKLGPHVAAKNQRYGLAFGFEDPSQPGMIN